MDLHGKTILGSTTSSDGSTSFHAENPATGEPLQPDYLESTEEEIDRAVQLAHQAYPEWRRQPADRRADFLEEVIQQLETLREEIVRRAHRESGLTEGRLNSELDRTTGQIQMFADLIREGSWVEARIDTAPPSGDAPDVRRMRMPIGPVGVFAASNFPLAFSVAGGDTISAWAAGNPVVVKAHPSTPGTCEWVARGILRAIEKQNMPEGLFGLIHGISHESGETLVRHPHLKAVGFTGSFKGGKALFDAANDRPEPIPVYAEMGSVNPVFLLPGALEERGDEIARGLTDSVTLGVGQFCTNPGVVVGQSGSGFAGFRRALEKQLSEAPAGTMLYSGIAQKYAEGIRGLEDSPGVTVLARSRDETDPERNQGAPVAFQTNAETFLENRQLEEEVFGPSTLLVEGDSEAELAQVARNLSGHLSASIHGTEEELQHHRELISELEDRVGRLIFNGFPTGVRVCHAMQHGGPYPATTDPLSTSVGTAAIERFSRPVCYQDFPPSVLPPELKDENPRDIWRLVDGRRTREGIDSGS